jgi:hypothetical protein
MDFIETLVLASFIFGLLCRRLSTALIVGGTLALAYATLVMIGLWQLIPDENLLYLFGALAVACLTILLPAVAASALMHAAQAWLGGRGPAKPA